MGRPLLKSDCDELSAYAHKRNIICSGGLLEALKINHGLELNEQVPAPVLPPIPNERIAIAASIAFPRMILNRIEAIQRATLTEFPNLTIHELKSQRRTAVVVRARQVAMYLSKTMTGQSLPEIGRRFGGRDHTTVLHAVRKIEGLVAADPILAAQVDRIKDFIPDAAS